MAFIKLHSCKSISRRDHIFWSEQELVFSRLMSSNLAVRPADVASIIRSFICRRIITTKNQHPWWPLFCFWLHILFCHFSIQHDMNTSYSTAKSSLLRKIKEWCYVIVVTHAYCNDLLQFLLLCGPNVCYIWWQVNFIQGN